MVLAPAPIVPLGGDAQSGGKRRGASVKTLKRMLKKAGLKTTGRKAALTRRAKKAHLKLRGGADDADTCAEKGMDFDGSKCVPKPTPSNSGDMGGKRRRKGSKKGKVGVLGF